MVLLFSASSRQSGIALPVSLIMTLLIALLGMTMLRGGIIGELVTSNQQQKFIATEAAQSSIEAIWQYPHLKDQIGTNITTTLDNPVPVVQAATDTGLTSNYDFASTKGTVDIDGEVTVQYCGEAEPIGGSLDANESSLSLVSALVDVSSRATIENTNAKALVVQRAAITSVRAGRLGNCVIH